ncbi:hypothetical protein C8R44DRAFT_749113 [Mycena epipterygia]|nr:hypothetical protein C8R44DRAFT_749113 [Mycena epipterygia]
MLFKLAFLPLITPLMLGSLLQRPTGTPCPPGITLAQNLRELSSPPGITPGGQNLGAQLASARDYSGTDSSPPPGISSGQNALEGALSTVSYSPGLSALISISSGSSPPQGITPEQNLKRACRTTIRGEMKLRRKGGVKFAERGWGWDNHPVDGMGVVIADLLDAANVGLAAVHPPPLVPTKLYTPPPPTVCDEERIYQTPLPLARGRAGVRPRLHYPAFGGPNTKNYAAR